MREHPVVRTDLPFPKRSGKVRDVYDLGDDSLLIVATDRVSAFDHVMPTPIPGKGRLLTEISAFWFARFARRFDHHLRCLPDVADLGSLGLVPRDAAPLVGRSMRVTRTAVVPVECVARGYLAGSAWSEYQEFNRVAGVRLPEGLRPGDPLPAPLFTPAVKNDVGHDENISYERLVASVGASLASDLREKTLRLYTAAAAAAAERGLILADTKLEWGHAADGRLLLIDELLTPDSSRYWPADTYEPGRAPPSFDKQPLRDYLAGCGWDRVSAAPALPPDVVDGTRRRYQEAYQRITGRTLDAPDA